VRQKILEGALTLTVMSIEIRKCGINVVWITAAVLVAFIILCITGGDLVNLPVLGFEVMCPFLIAILVCEWVETLSDPMIDVIWVHSKSLFQWVLNRFIVVAGISGTLCALCMFCLRLWVLDFSLVELSFVFIATAFFFTSIGVFTSFLTKQPHVPAVVCGMIWLFALMARSLIRLSVIAYIYPLLKFADNDTEMWITNKIILLTVSVCLWLWIYFICRKRKPVKSIPFASSAR